MATMRALATSLRLFRCHCSVAGMLLSRSALEPTQGVLHCGGVLRDAALHRQTLADLRQVAAPKTAASISWHGRLQAHPVSQQVRGGTHSQSSTPRPFQHTHVFMRRRF